MTGRVNVGTLTDRGQAAEYLKPVNGFLTTVQVAARVDRSQNTVWRWIKSGELEHVMSAENETLISEDALAAFIRRHNKFSYKRTRKFLKLLREDKKPKK